MSEAQQHNKCPECGCERLIRDGATGEVVCAECGIVVGEREYVHGFTPKPKRGSFAMAGGLGSGKPGLFEVLKYGDQRYLWLVGRSVDKTEAHVAAEVAALVDRIGASKTIEETAFYYAKRLLKAMREKKRKMATGEIAAVTVWTACKLHSFPITMDEYVHMLGWDGKGVNGNKSLLKLINKAEAIMPLPKVVPDPKKYIAKLAAKLYSRLDTVDGRYIAAIEAYARMLCDAAIDDVSGKDPVCTASTALCVADELLGGIIGRTQVVMLTGGGYSSSTAEAMKMKKPPPPESLWAVFKTTHGKRVARALVQTLHPPSHSVKEVKENEGIGNVAN